MQHYEDKTNEAIMILEANVDVLTSLRKFYERLIENAEFPLGNSCRDGVLAFAVQLDDMIHDSKMQIARAKVLVRITADRKSLVSQALGCSLPYALILTKDRSCSISRAKRLRKWNC